MAQYITAIAFTFATLLASGTTSANAASGAPNQIVSDCALISGVHGNYQVTPAKYGETTGYAVTPGGAVSKAQSRDINRCISVAIQGRPTLFGRSETAQPNDIGTCRAEYKAKLRTSRDGRDYRGDNIGTRAVSGLFGRKIGRQLIENEYDRCLNHVAYLHDRCPTGVFSGGSGYCIKRPY